MNEDDMVKAGVQDMSGCIEAMEEMFKLMKVGDYRMDGANGNSHGSMVMFPKESEFPEMPVDGPDRRFMAMPAYLGGEFDFDDDFLINRARTVTDNIMLYEAWEEEMKPNAYNTIPIPAVRVEDLIAEGKMTSDQIDDLGDILLGKKPVHRKDDEIVIYSVGGMPTEDVAWGTMVYRNALKKGIGQKLNLWDKPKMVV